jgi:hypothetical protein
VFALGAAAFLHAAQPFNIGKPINPKYTDYFDPPNHLQKRAIVTGSEAESEGMNLVRLKKVHIESFQVTGEPEAVLDADEALYDRAAQTVSSAGRIQARTADGRFSVSGVGFSMTLTNKSLMISNNVRTVIRGLGSTPNKK